MIKLRLHIFKLGLQFGIDSHFNILVFGNIISNLYCRSTSARCYDRPTTSTVPDVPSLA